MSYRIKVEPTVAGINKEEWDAIATSPFTCHAFVKIVERITTIKIKPRYILVYDGGKLISFVTAYIQEDAEYFTLEESVYGRHYQKIRKLLPELNPCLLCYSPLGNVCRTIEISKAVRNPGTVCQLIVDTLKAQATKEGLSQYGFFNVNEEDVLLRQTLRKNRFAKSFSSFEVFLDTRFDNFDSYLTSLSKSRRGLVKREVSKFKKQKIITEFTSAPGEKSPLITRLFNENFYKYQEKNSNFTSTILESLFAEMAEDCGLILDRSGNDIVSCSMYITWKNRMNMFKVGQAADAARNSCSFFNTAFYQPIHCAIDKKLERIGLGSGAYRYKMLRGAEIRPMYHFIKKTNPFANTVLGYIFQILSKRKFKKHHDQVKDFL